jgi:DNA modification methylase
MNNASNSNAKTIGQRPHLSNALQIELRTIDRFVLPKRQTRKHPKSQIESIKSSIQQFGFIGVIVVDEDGSVVIGAARLEAAKQLGYEELPAIVISHLSTAQLKALRIADNKLVEGAQWDMGEVKLEFEDILGEVPDFDLEITGFSTTEIDFTLNAVLEDDDPLDESVEVDRQQPAVSQVGDVWQVGKHVLVCGDAKSTQAYAQLLSGEQVDYVITDPPWNVPIDGHVGNSGKVQHSEFVEASGEMTHQEFADFLTSVLSQMEAAARDGALLYCFIDWRSVELVLQLGRKLGLGLINICVWNKSNAGMGSLYRSKHELVCVFKKGNAPHINNVQLGANGRYRTNVWDYAGANSFGEDRMEQLTAHPTAKPVAMIADAILDVTKRGDIVLDPFCGSGTTLLAAEKTGRVARCLELDPHYVDVAIRRFEKQFGISAIHAGTGLSFEALSVQRQAEAKASVAGNAAARAVRKRQRPSTSVAPPRLRTRPARSVPSTKQHVA